MGVGVGVWLFVLLVVYMICMEVCKMDVSMDMGSRIKGSEVLLFFLSIFRKGCMDFMLFVVVKLRVARFRFFFSVF